MIVIAGEAQQSILPIDAFSESAKGQADRHCERSAAICAPIDAFSESAKEPAERHCERSEAICALNYGVSKSAKDNVIVIAAICVGKSKIERSSLRAKRSNLYSELHNAIYNNF